MKIIIAPNAFKGSLDPAQAAAAIQKGLQSSSLNAELVQFPLADGGDHTLLVILNHIRGKRISCRVTDPLGRLIHADYGISSDGKTAIVEFALAAGMSLLKKQELDPVNASSYGVGQLISDAVARGVKEIWLGVGGSATVDGGTGLLQALGAVLLNKDGKPVSPGAKGLAELEVINTDQLKARLNGVRFTVLCDVDNPLTGDNGAAKIFGPQKGADEKTVAQLEKGLSHLAEVALQTTGKAISDVKHGGAAGGVPAALYGLLDAELTSGIDFILQLGDFDKALHNAQALITGEGKLDSQTLEGKGPAGAARLAKQRGLMTIALAGAIEEDSRHKALFDAIFTIGAGPQSVEEAINHTARDLARTAREVGNLLAATLCS